MDCIFCKIINGEIPSNIVYEDDVVSVFLDVNPQADGHSLIVPKKHYNNVLDCDDQTLSHVQEVVKKLYPIYRDRLGCEGLTLIQNNDYGQEVKHYHMHLIPRYADDDLHLETKLQTKNIQEIFDKLK